MKRLAKQKGRIHFRDSLLDLLVTNAFWVLDVILYVGSSHSATQKVIFKFLAIASQE